MSTSPPSQPDAVRPPAATEEATPLAQCTLALGALRESEERFRCAFDHAPIGMAIVGLDGRWLKVNRALCEIVGYAEHELLDGLFQDITHPEDLAADLALVRQLLTGQARCSHMTKRYLHRGGRVVWIVLSVSLVRDAAGAPLYFISQVQDVTERKRVEWLEEDRSAALEMVAAGEPVGAVMTRLLRMVERQLPAGTAPSALLLRDGSMHQWAPTLPQDVREAVAARVVSLAAALCAHAVGHEPPLTVSDIGAAGGAWDGVCPAAARHGLRGCWSVPVRSNDGTFLALLAVYVREHRPPTPHETQVLEAAARLAKVAVEHSIVAEQLAHLARHDPLTGLANRLTFDDRLQQAIAAAKRSGANVALLALDLDHFKRVNDTLGHQAGDVLLQQFAQRLRATLRESDTVARLGGDEFAVVLPHLTERSDALGVAGKLIAALSAPFDIGGRELRVTGSIGVAVYPHEAAEGTALQRAADAALYMVKQRGRNGYEVAESVTPARRDVAA